MDDATLRDRLWLGFAQLQALLGGRAAQGEVVESDELVASFVPKAPDSPTLNAVIALHDELDELTLQGLQGRYEDMGIHRWGVWTDGTKRQVVQTLQRRSMRLTSSSPGMATTLNHVDVDGAGPAGHADLATVGHVNDLAYGNPDGRLEKTLAPLPPGPAARLPRRPPGPPGVRRARAPPRRGLRRLVRRHRPVRPPPGPRHRGDAPRRGRRQERRVHQRHPPGHQPG